MLKKITCLALVMLSLNSHCYARSHHHHHHHHTLNQHHARMKPVLSEQVTEMRTRLIQTRQNVNKYCNNGECTDTEKLIRDYKKSEDQFKCYTDAFDNHHQFEKGYEIISDLESQELITKVSRKSYSAYQRLLAKEPAYLGQCSHNVKHIT